MKWSPAADDGDNDARWAEVSTRRRLILDAGLEDRDGVYLCILADKSSPSALALLAANVTIVSPCKHADLVTVLLQST